MNTVNVISASENQTIQYRKAKTWQVATAMLPGAAAMCFYMLLTYATYIGNSNFGVLVAVTGVIITFTRVFDGITDPICAYIIERFESKLGKIRIFMFAGWAIMALATTLMCNLGAGHFSGVAGLAFFITTYLLFILGYTLQGISTQLIGPVMTNDPKQRPTLAVWSTIYSYLAPMIVMLISMVVILPKYNNLIDTPFLAEFNIWVVVLSLILYLIASIGITPYDKNENFSNITVGSNNQEKPSFHDMLKLIRDNKELQRYIIAASSDKLAQTIGSASVITVLIFGIMIGNISFSTIISTVAMLPSIIFAIIGAKLAGRHGNRKIMVQWTWFSIVLNVFFGAFLFFSDTTKITVAIIPTIVFLFLSFANNSMKMVVSTATGAMRMDIIDYELYRSGKYMPASVSATYSFIDKLISSFGATIATLMIGLIGYTTTTPQEGDPLTMGVKVLTVIIYCGFPILGWLCTIAAMKNSHLTREKMVDIQRDIQEKKKESLKLATES